MHNPDHRIPCEVPSDLAGLLLDVHGQVNRAAVVLLGRFVGESARQTWIDGTIEILEYLQRSKCSQFEIVEHVVVELRDQIALECTADASKSSVDTLPV